MNRIQIDTPPLFQDTALKEPEKKSKPAVSFEPPKKEKKWNKPLLAALAGLAFMAGLLGGLVAGQLSVPGGAPSIERSRTESGNVSPEAEKFYIVDGEGNYRGVFGMQQDGQIIFSFTEADGSPLVVFEQAAQGMGALKFYRQGKPSLALGGFDNGRSGLMLFDGSGTPRAEMAASANGEPAMRFFDDGSNARLEMTLAENEYPSLKLNQGYPESGIQLGISEEGTKGLFYYAGYGFPSVGLVQSQDKDPVLGFLNRNHELLWASPPQDDSQDSL